MADKTSLQLDNSSAPHSSVNLSLFREQADALLNNYINGLVHGKSVIATLKCLHSSVHDYMDLFIVRSISMVLQKTEDKQARVASLLPLLYDTQLVQSRQVVRAFEYLLGYSGNEQKLFSFFVSAADDSIINPYFLSRLPPSFIRKLGDDLLYRDEPNLLFNCEVLEAYNEDSKSVIAEFMVEGVPERLEAFIKNYTVPPYPLTEHDRNSVVPLIRKEDLGDVLVLRLIIDSMTGTAAQKEHVSCFINTYYSSLISASDIQLGLARAIRRADDLRLDCPCAEDIIIKHICRFYVDDLLAPSFITDFLRLGLGDDTGTRILSRTCQWLSQGQSALVAKFQKIWFAGEMISVELTKFNTALHSTLREYLNTGYLKDAVHSFREMAIVPDMEAYAVKKILIFAMDEKASNWIFVIQFLSELVSNSDINVEAIRGGLRLIEESMSDLILDIPKAVSYMDDYFRPQLLQLARLHEL